MRELWKLEKGYDAVINSRMPGTSSAADIIKLINGLKDEYDVPVGVKIAGSDYIEYELEVISKTDADFITIDGFGGGTAGSPPYFGGQFRASTALLFAPCHSMVGGS